jgi:hypothetical protein
VIIDASVAGPFAPVPTLRETFGIYLVTRKVMDVKAFEKERASKLNDYKKEYELMKRDYSTTVDAAIQEGDPKEQNDLIQKVLSINSDLSEYLRTVIGDLNKGQNSINSTTVNELNAELVKYQQEFQAVKASQDKLTTLKKIQATNSGLADTAITTYYIYLTVIGILVLICVYFTINTAWTTGLVARVTTALSPAAT